MQIEQAVFSSAETDKLAGYQILGHSEGLQPQDLKELAAWGPSHGSLVESGPEATSFNFHRLASGSYCVSRTMAAGAEYSARGGLRVYTQSLVLPPAELARFANNPFAVLRAALAGGDLTVHEDVPRKLPSLSLPGRTAAVDSSLLARLQVKPGVEWLCRVVAAALDSPGLIISGCNAPEQVIAGLMNCLPPECRLEFSFSTGLVFSPRRPFRIMALPADEAGWRRRRHMLDAEILDLSGDQPVESDPLSAWANLIRQVLAANQASFLAAQFSKRRFNLSCDDLPALALQLLEEWDAARLPVEEREQERRLSDDARRNFSEDWLDTLQRAHAAHHRFQGISLTDETSSAKTPHLTSAGIVEIHPPQGPKALEVSATDTLEKLELLDDVIFSAIGGNRAALEELRQIWPALRSQLGDELLAESREQYLRHSLMIWQGSVDPSGNRDPQKAIEALDVLSIIFGE